MVHSSSECPPGHLDSHIAAPSRAKRRYHRAKGQLRGLTAVAMHHMTRQLKLLPEGCTMCHIIITEAEFATLSPSSDVISYGESTMTAIDCSMEQTIENHPNHQIPLTQYYHRSSTEPVVLVLLTIRLGPVSHCSVVGVPSLGRMSTNREGFDPEREEETRDNKRQMPRTDQSSDIGR
jgi:hypothetical protein